MASITEGSGLFEDRLFADYRVWAAKCGLLTVAMAVGVLFNSLKTACIAVILAFAFWQGLRPLTRFAWRLRSERCQCRNEFEELKETGALAGEAFVVELAQMDTSECGSVLRMYQAVVINRGRMSKPDTIDRFLEVERQRLEAMVAGPNAAVDQVVQCGLLGSLIGITASLAAGVDIQQVAAGMSTMTSTTVVGIGASITLWGFTDIANRAIDQHLAQLDQLGGMLGGDDGFSQESGGGVDGDPGGPFESLFAERRHAAKNCSTPPRVVVHDSL